MPEVAPGSKVLVTGANGYIASWIVRYLLEAGYNVRGTVRSEVKGVFLKKTWKNYDERFELAVVSDMTESGAFDEAVQGVDAVLHTASPFHYAAEDPSEMINPAVKGTVGILQSIVQSGTSVRRVVILSSNAAIANPSDHGVLTEANWNTEEVADVLQNGRQSTPLAKYCASKSMAERSAWDFVQERLGKLTWDLVTLCPPDVFGPVIHDTPTPASLNQSAKDFYEALFENCIAPDQYLFEGGWVDVRDIAMAHVHAIQKDLEIGEGLKEEGRFLVVAGMWTWQDWFDVANELGYGTQFPSIPKGTLGATPQDGFAWTVTYDSSKVQNILGLKFRSKQELLKDTLEDFKRRSWI